MAGRRHSFAPFRHATWALVGATALLPGCGWPGLIAGALATPTSDDDAATNVAIAGGTAWVARSASGLERLDLDSGASRRFRAPAPADRIDDIAVADGLLFALDAAPPGNLLVFRVEADGSPRLLTSTVVPVGPFSGVAAAGGHVIVSGGTSRLTLRRYAIDGSLSPPATADFGRGQPDIALAGGGRVALVSTHVQGPRFGLTVADVESSPLALRERGYVELEGAGFTDGGFRPANFPLQSVAYGDHVLVAHGGGLSVLDAPAGAAPTLLATLPLPLQATAIAVDAGARRAFVVGADPRPGLLEIDLEDPTAPRVVAQRALPADGSPCAIALQATHLVVALQGGGVHVEARAARSLSPAATPQETSP